MNTLDVKDKAREGRALLSRFVFAADKRISNWVRGLREKSDIPDLILPMCQILVNDVNECSKKIHTECSGRDFFACINLLAEGLIVLSKQERNNWFEDDYKPSQKYKGLCEHIHDIVEEFILRSQSDAMKHSLNITDDVRRLSFMLDWANGLMRDFNSYHEYFRFSVVIPENPNRNKHCLYTQKNYDMLVNLRNQYQEVYNQFLDDTAINDNATFDFSREEYLRRKERREKREKPQTAQSNIEKRVTLYDNAQKINVKRRLKQIQKMGYDLVCIKIDGAVCPECAKWRDRVFSIGGMDSRFPSFPVDIFLNNGIHEEGHKFWCCYLILMEYDLKNFSIPFDDDERAIESTNRPYIDNRSDEEIDLYNRYNLMYRMRRQ